MIELGPAAPPERGPVSACLLAELRELARRNGIVVWLDKEGSYTAFADELARRPPAEGEVPMFPLRGSYLELMLALEDEQDGAEMTPLVVHVPGHTDESIARTPRLELYCAGTQHQRALATLVRNAAHGRATPSALEAFLAQPGLTLEGADAWLARQAAAPAAGGEEGPDLSLFGAEALHDDMVERGALALQLEQPAVARAVWRRAEVLLGLAEADRRRVLEEPDAPDAPDTRDAPDARDARTRSAGELASDVATALTGWALAVEFVHDLRRAPVDPWLAPLRHLPRPVVVANQKLAGHLRRHHPERYMRCALHMEALLPIEVAQATAADLGKVDTFQFEDTKVMAAALDALHGARFRDARELAVARTSGKSFWTTHELRRRIAWNLVEQAAQLGCAVVDHAGLLDGCAGLGEAVERYAAGGYQVDRAHRQLEQTREELPQLELPEAQALRARLDELRGVYRRWADRVAHVFSALCRRDGFLPAAELQQRALFEDVVVPAASEELTAYFLVDALRFEMGQQLAESLREKSTGEVHLAARLAELPTLTEVGMNALAPVARAGRLTVDYDGKNERILGFRAGALRVDGPEDRRRAIHERLGGDTCPKLTLEELGARDAANLRKTLARARAVVVHCEGIDKAGEKGVGLVVFERELQRLRGAWQVLYEAGVKRFVITADHGFLLHDEVTREAVAHGKQTDPQRRHVLMAVRREQDGEVCVSAAELGYDGAEFAAAFPAGIAPFDRGARAKDFVHGGNSLQERVIPVLTVRHRHAAGGEKVSYEVTARVGERQAGGMHCLYAVIRPIRQTNLMYGASAELELVLEPADDDVATAGVQVELCDVHHARRTGAGVIATVGKELAAFFRLSGDDERRVAVRVRAVSRAVDVAPATTAERFQVILRTRPAPLEAPAIARTRTPRAPLPTTTTTTMPTTLPTAAPPPAAWLEALPEAVRPVFRHLADHGSINEAEATALLGGARQFRAFSRELDKYRLQTPFAIRVEMASGTKCYVRGDSESS